MLLYVYLDIHQLFPVYTKMANNRGHLLKYIIL